MRIAVPAETAEGERRVALVPKSVASLTKDGTTVAVQAGAGQAAGYTDAAYKDAGAEIVTDAAKLVAAADLVLHVRRPAAAEIAKYKAGAVLVGLLEPQGEPKILGDLAKRKVTSFRLEALPRISRAQDMDVLSSQATISGYVAAVQAAARLPRVYPLMMTAAGTITPARIFVIGAGVAGLQAIATSRRLGAVVEAFDVRPVVKEQVESLGARFVEVGVESADQQDAGGYAKALSADQEAREREVLAEHVASSDAVITTAFVPNRPAPTLITEEMVKAMRPGSVIIDLAAPSGGNCALTEPGKDVDRNGVAVWGPLNLPATMPAQASQLFSHNVTRFISSFLKDGAIQLDFEDQVVADTCMTHEGEIRGDQLKALAGGGK